ncbi:MAG: glycosyltransferase family 4 protein, partial [Actinobacteria bacterium]|nr:glycosyltransferase family 4 protein [Actinomycetota bacterium]
MRRVGINLLWMVPGIVGGSETYMTRLLRGLAERDSRLDYTLFALPQMAEAHPDLASQYRVSYAPLSGQMKSFRVAGENSWLAKECRKQMIDLVHHGGGTMPLVRTARRSVLTIHDLQFLYFPEYFTRTKLRFLKMMVPRSAEAARLVLVPSEFSRRTVIERLSIDPSTVIVVPHGIAPRDQSEVPTDIRSRFELDGPYFLYPAATYPHKNHLVLLEAFSHLLKDHPEALLVLTGAKAWQEWSVAKDMGQRIQREIVNLGISERVRSLGYVSSADLDALYNDAVALTFPSRFEGFGAPALEAMARGCAVIASNATALPEVLATCGKLVSPDNAEEWCQAMALMLEDEDLRAAYAKAGLQRACIFDW